jgi:hypothetical protein
LSSIEARKAATRTAEGVLVDRDEFLRDFAAGLPALYYKGPNLSRDAEFDDAYRRYRSWVWSFVHEGQRGFLVQKRTADGDYAYTAIPRKGKC